MVKQNYQHSCAEEKATAKAMAKNARTSLKHSTELCRELKGMQLKRAEQYLNNVLEKKEFIPIRRYRKKTGHRKGEAKSFTKSGRYATNTVKAFIKLLNSVKANADYKGLDAENLIVKHAFASQGFSRAGYQAKGQMGGKRREKKSTHLEIVVQETKK